MNAAILAESTIVLMFVNILVALYSTRILQLERDFALTLYLLIFGIYIVFAPALSLNSAGADLTWSYFVVQFTAVTLLILPLIATYKYFFRHDRTAMEPMLSRWHFIFPPVALLGVAAFYYIALRNGLFLRRIGHSALAGAQSSLNFPELVFYRGFEEAAPAIAFMSVLAAITARRQGARVATVAHTLTAAGVLLGLGLFLFVNNRLQTLLFGLAAFIAVHYFSTRRQSGSVPNLSALRLAAMAAIALPVAFAVQVARNVALSGGEQGVADLTGALLEGEVESTPLNWRLNGVDLAARIADKGLANASWGESYIGPLALTFNVVFAPGKAEDVKLATRTNVKTVLTNDVLGVNEPDNFSSVITDIYGNFWFFPFPLAGALIGLILARCQSVLLSPTGPVALLLAVYVLIYILEFEKEFITLVQNLPKFALIPLLAGLLSPVRLRRSGSE